ncbi:cytochrome C oxidase copper chaperone-domain-containing protein [Syncephalis plumigaleata]|nr:cytochrome C oxidase copper chaperone-domain-containing protein [Syncephalis plumigaleata]
MGQSSFKSVSVEPAVDPINKLTDNSPSLSSKTDTAQTTLPNATSTATIVRDPVTGKPLDKDGKPLKPCCVCPDTKRIRDECMLRTGDENACSKEIEAHKACLRALGFKI